MWRYSINSSSKGFVFFSILIILQLSSLLGMTALQQTVNTMKQVDHFWQRRVWTDWGQRALSQQEDRLSVNLSDCMMPLISAHEIAKKPLSWWRTHTCRGEFEKNLYYYAIERMGEDSCVVIGNANDLRPVTVNYYRMTLFALPERILGAKVILQSTTAVASDEILSCQGKIHFIHLGRQMWREI